MGFWQGWAGWWSGPARLDLEQRFERVRRLSGGTMSEVWEVRERAGGARFALKLLDPVATAAFEERFVRQGRAKPSEGEISLKLKHPRLVETFEHGRTVDGRAYLLMEMLAGTNLHILAGRNPNPLVGRRVALCRQMVEAVAAVHQAGFLHRDLCPSNFLVDPSLDAVKLFDFGLTIPNEPAFLAAGNRTGKPSYMAPELIRRQPIDLRADLFALGVTLYETCTGKAPWESATPEQAILRAGLPPPPMSKSAPDVPPALAEGVELCLAVDPARRPASAAALLKRWKGLADGAW